MLSGRLDRTINLPFLTSSFSFSLGGWLKDWAKDKARYMPTKSLKKQPKTCKWQAKFESYMSQGKLEFILFSSPNEKEVAFNGGMTFLRLSLHA